MEGVLYSYVLNMRVDVVDGAKLFLELRDDRDGFHTFCFIILEGVNHYLPMLSDIVTSCLMKLL